MNTPNNKSLKDVEWGSPKFYEIINAATDSDKLSTDKRRIDNLIDKLETDEGWKYLKRSVEEYYGY